MLAARLQGDKLGVALPALVVLQVHPPPGKLQAGMAHASVRLHIVSYL